MLFRTHIVFSLAVYFLLSYYISMPLYVLGFVLLATVFVDIDIRNSRFGNRWYFRPLQWITRHRGVIHSLFFGFILSIVILVGNKWAGVGFFVGYLSHLLLDCLTKSGVRLFWPISQWRVRGFFKSGGIFEEIFFVLLLLGDIFIVGKFFFELML